MIKVFDFDFSILKAHHVLHPLMTTTYDPSPRHRRHYPNLQLSQVLAQQIRLVSGPWEDRSSNCIPCSFV